MAIGGSDEEGKGGSEGVRVGHELPSPGLLHHGGVGSVRV